jgi:hypothetical protein
MREVNREKDRFTSFFETTGLLMNGLLTCILFTGSREEG